MSGVEYSSIYVRYIIYISQFNKGEQIDLREVTAFITSALHRYDYCNLDNLCDLDNFKVTAL